MPVTAMYDDGYQWFYKNSIRFHQNIQKPFLFGEKEKTPLLAIFQSDENGHTYLLLYLFLKKIWRTRVLFVEATDTPVLDFW